MDDKFKLNNYNQAYGLNNTLIQQNTKMINNIKIDKTRFGIVVSYNSTTKIAVINYDFDPTNIPILNYSGASLVANDRVLIKALNGKLTNAYITDKL